VTYVAAREYLESSREAAGATLPVRARGGRGNPGWRSRRRLCVRPKSWTILTDTSMTDASRGTW